MSRAVDLRGQGRQAFDAGTTPWDTRQKRAAGELGFKAMAVRRRALLRELQAFPLALANAIMREPKRRSVISAEHVQALADRHGVALARTLKSWKIWHSRGSSSALALVPFLLAGYYLARMLTHIARPPHRLNVACVNAADDGKHALDDWGTVAFARTLFPSERDQDAWLENCGAASMWIEKLLHSRHDALALVRRCANPTCPAPFGGLRIGRTEPKTCGRSRCRVALFRAAGGRRPRRNVTTQRSKRKVFGTSEPPAPRRSPLVSRPAAR